MAKGCSSHKIQFLAIALTAALCIPISCGRPSRAEESRPGMSIMVFPLRLRAEIITDERHSLDTWPGRKEKYEAAIRGAAGRLIQGLTDAGYRMAIEGNAPAVPDRQQNTQAGALWPYVHPALMAGADAFLLCDITRMEYSERIGHYLFEAYSVHTYRLTATLDVKLYDVRAERTIKTATITDSATHRVHRLFWDTIWIHHYTTGPDLAEKLMESVAGKIVRAIE